MTLNFQVLNLPMTLTSEINAETRKCKDEPVLYAGLKYKLID